MLKLVPTVMFFNPPSWLEIGVYYFGDLDFDAARAKIENEVVDLRMNYESCSTCYTFGKLFRVVFVGEILRLRSNELKGKWGKEGKLEVDYITSEEAFYSAVKRISEMKLRNFSYC